MNLEKSTYMQGKFRKFIPRKQLNEGWHYYELHDSEFILGVRLVLNEVYFVTEEGGQPVVNKDTKRRVFEWNQQIESRILTKEEYAQIISSKFEEE